MSEKEYFQPELPHTRDLEIFETFSQENGIKYIMLDLDGTQLDTDRSFDEKADEISEELNQYFEEENLPQTLNKHQYDIWKENNKKPEKIQKHIIRALPRLKGFEKLDQTEYESIVNTVMRLCSTFYNESPQLHEGVLHIHWVLNKAYENGILAKRGYYSHAQNNWTKIKSMYIDSEYEKEYQEESVIPTEVYTTPITEKKTPRRWKSKVREMGGNTENTLIVGDSLSADIIPALQAGFRNLVWVRNNQIPNEEELAFLRSYLQNNINLCIANTPEDIISCLEHPQADEYILSLVE